MKQNKVLLKKSKKPKEKVVDDDVLKRLTRLERKVEAMSKINHTEAIEESVQANMMNEGEIDPTKTLRKRHHDDDQDTHADSDKEKKKRRRKGTEPSKKDKDTTGSSKEGKALSKSSKSDKTMDAEETVQDVVVDDEELVHDDAMDAENLTHDDAAPNQDRFKWFKQDVVVRPKTPDPNWFKEPNANDAPEQSWFKELVDAEKDQKDFDDLMGSIIDFTKFAKNHLKKDKITKADLEGTTFALLKGGLKNNIELEYNLEQCYLALTDRIDWTNPEEDRCPYDLYKPLPLQGPPRLHLNEIEDMLLLYVQKKLHHLKGHEQVDLFIALHLFTQRIVLKKRVEDVQLRVESYQINSSSQCHKSYVLFSDGMLKLVHDILNSMLHNFELSYNNSKMPTRAWSEKDKKRTSSMLKKIEEALLERRIMRSLECFIGGRHVETDYRLLMRIE
ncbi:hypothetical protein Tco_0537202 [Tanacetum coccineum]